MWAQIQMPHLVRKCGPVHPSPFQRDVGGASSLDGGNGGGQGMEEGDTPERPRQWEAHPVCPDNEPQ